jgi:hypothetical protein
MKSPWKWSTSLEPEREYLVLASSIPPNSRRPTWRLFRGARAVRKQLGVTDGVIGFSLLARPLRKQYATLSVATGRLSKRGKRAISARQPPTPPSTAGSPTSTRSLTARRSHHPLDIRRSRADRPPHNPGARRRPPCHLRAERRHDPGVGWHLRRANAPHILGHRWLCQWPIRSPIPNRPLNGSSRSGSPGSVQPTRCSAAWFCAPPGLRWKAPAAPTARASDRGDPLLPAHARLNGQALTLRGDPYAPPVVARPPAYSMRAI